MAGTGKRVATVKVAMAMLMVKLANAGLNIFYVLASEDGMDLNILLAYRFLFATAFLAPFALILERNRRPKLTGRIMGLCFLSSVVGGLLSQTLYLKGLVLTSVTIGAAMINLIPAITFILAILFRMEKLAIRTSAGKAKLVGTLVGIAGAMVITLYKGKEINLWSSIHIHHHAVPNMNPPHPPRTHQVLGTLLCLGSAVLFAGWFIIQAKLNKIYPCFYSSTVFVTLISSIQWVVIASILDHRWDQWKLGWNVRLLSVLYAGIINGMSFAITTWCVKMRGPLFVSVFGPLLLVIVSILGSFILDQHLHVGSVIGGAIIVGGIYVVLWGKMKEAEETEVAAEAEGELEARHE